MAEGNGRDPDDVEEVFERDVTWNIHQRIHAVMSEVGHIEKDQTIKDRSGKPMYDYISHDAVTAAIRVPFIKYGVAVLPSVTAHSADGNRTEMTVQVDFINIDNPDDFISVSTIGYGVDPSDKGPGKALSYAVKYAYLKLLMLNSADDIEADIIAHAPSLPTGETVEQAKDTARVALEAWTRTFKETLDNTKTIAAIDDLQKENKSALMMLPDATREYFVSRIENRKTSMQTEVDRQMEVE